MVTATGGPENRTLLRLLTRFAYRIIRLIRDLFKSLKIAFIRGQLFLE